MVAYDLPGAYIQIDLLKDNFMLILLEGNFVDIMCDINPEYEQHVRFKYGRKKFYICILKAIYGMTESAPMWCKL